MLTSLLRDILMLLTILFPISPISGDNDSRKRHARKRLIFKIGTIHPHGLNEQFSIIWSFHSFCFCPARADKSVDFSPFHSIVYIHPPPTYSLRASASLTVIDFKNSKWLTYFCILLCICYCFSHLIGLLSVTWLSLLYKFRLVFLYIFCFSK